MKFYRISITKKQDLDYNKHNVFGKVDKKIKDSTLCVGMATEECGNQYKDM